MLSNLCVQLRLRGHTGLLWLQWAFSTADRVRGRDILQCLVLSGTQVHVTHCSWLNWGSGWCQMMSWTSWPEHPDLCSVSVLLLALCGRASSSTLAWGRGKGAPARDRVMEEYVGRCSWADSKRREPGQKESCAMQGLGASVGSGWDALMWQGDGDRPRTCPKNNKYSLGCKELGLQKNMTFPHPAR